MTMTIEEIKDRLVDNEIDYLTDLVISDKYDELVEFVNLYCFSDFKDISEEEINEEYECRYEDEA